ncbi:MULTISPECIES: cob(I)yrinic acid a,c-diamide adenosyltransferase [Dictyoglomus]|jgi:cob(I)alamin adenosyltransferase|uniref:corrinoid adenosyltransferase n=1 Tax=Dictyoglomus turgidum (strain DSM 6724 / Z-1310) TaxID=515635 RepID=B8DYJ4_DICTD|nr:MULTISPECIES: cob(I)yrinic acid a,c-diamide adenosyltransferase [Dictyoglomus]ACK41376.1 ATP:corrinoid adenosyltransferase BtuR/CobO/CobP [Dictyoglomus turgidum DSM 6724]HBU31619.1 cob(I)alamin adenolsyltransferase [Dictyoglomus sp.]
MSINKLSRGLIQVYTGDGKGKTTAALGQSIRAAGHGLKVLFVQFIKGNSFTGEFLFLKNSQNITFWQFGRDCVYSSGIRENIVECNNCYECFIGKEGPSEMDIKVVRGGWERVKSVIEDYDLIVLDEISLAIFYKIISAEEIIEFLKNKPEKLEIILTGRYMPEAIMDLADLITEMKEVRHPYSKGISARWGIDY